jgi:hypothetical protein
MTSTYRVNYGNGQVEYPGGLKACRQFLTTCDGFAFVQQLDLETGDWFRVKGGR